jgi:hypothetical protein
MIIFSLCLNAGILLSFFNPEDGGNVLLERRLIFKGLHDVKSRKGKLVLGTFRFRKQLFVKIVPSRMQESKAMLKEGLATRGACLDQSYRRIVWVRQQKGDKE